MQAAVAALSDRKAELDVKVVQLVKLLRGRRAGQNVEAGRGVRDAYVRSWKRSGPTPSAS